MTGVKYESYLNKYVLRRRLKVGRVWESRIIMSRGVLFQTIINFKILLFFIYGA